MNRAFVKEGDGWHMCVLHNESCLFAEETGRCVLESCRFYSESCPEQQPASPQQTNIQQKK